MWHQISVCVWTSSKFGCFKPPCVCWHPQTYGCLRWNSQGQCRCTERRRKYCSELFHSVEEETLFLCIPVGTETPWFGEKTNISLHPCWDVDAMALRQNLSFMNLAYRDYMHADHLAWIFTPVWASTTSLKSNGITTELIAEVAKNITSNQRKMGWLLCPINRRHY